MAYDLKYKHFDDEENEHIYDVEFTVSKYYPATREQPEEGGEIEITSIKENGIEVEVNDETINKMMEQAEKEIPDADDFMDEEW